METYNIMLPKEVEYIINQLNLNNFESFVVGGCVRDSVLGKTPKDWDITTNATPDQIQKLFDKTIPTGIKHGTITVLINNKSFEVTTYRIDGNYSNNRHPDFVAFSSSLKDDLSRRDFTINAMAFNYKQGLIDKCNGIKDIQNNVINCVGNPNDRFQEDFLRSLRAIRFSCQLGFTIGKDTLLAIKRNNELIKNVSQERIRDELVKVLISNYPVKGIELFEATGLLKFILPELNECVGFDQKNKHHSKSVYSHIIKVLDSVPNNLEIRLAALLHDIAKPKCFTLGEDREGHFYGHHTEGYSMTKSILKRLKFDNDTINNVSILVKEHMSRFPKLRCATVKKLINRAGKENMDNLINLQIADIIGSKPPYDFEGIIELKKEVERIINYKEPLSLKDLAINGHDLMEIGMKPGKEMGIILNNLMQLVLDKPELNTKEMLLKETMRLLN